MTDMQYKVIVGLEIHVQLNTQSKLFCPCRLEFGAEPNSRTCPVCLGLPGSLPVINKKAVEYAALVGVALNCQIAQFTKWDRKSYYYPDLPKNYQISQYDLPLASGGFIEIPISNGKLKKVGITIAHLEEDAGKNLHSSANLTQVDLNRAGTPLLEIVTDPDMNSPQEVKTLAVELQQIVRYLGVSKADMQKGHMRFEPNVNLIVTKAGSQYKTPITEIKNLNSFRALEKSIDYEIKRQLDDFVRTGRVMKSGNKSTRGWDDVNETTVLQREKEEAHDYRYFPDPDLVPLRFTNAKLDEIRSCLCELPMAKKLRYIREYNLNEYDAGVLTTDRKTAEFYEQVLTYPKVDPKRACTVLTQEWMKLANKRRCRVYELGLTPKHLADESRMIDVGDITSTAAESVITTIVESGDAENKLFEKVAIDKNMLSKSDEGELEKLVDEALENNPQAVADVKSGGKKSKKARGFLMGQVMQKTKGSANPKVVSELLARKLR